MNFKHFTAFNPARLARHVVLLAAASALSVPAFATTVQANTAHTPGAGRPQQTQNQARSLPAQSFSVSYYNADPAKGGQLIKTVTLQRPARGGHQGAPGQNNGQGQPSQPAAQRPQPGQGGPDAHKRPSGPNPFLAQAPAGAKFAVIKRGDQTRVIDLSQPLPPKGQGQQRGQPQGQNIPVPAPATK